MGLGAVDKVYRFEVQCCRVPPGKCEVITTGGLSVVSQDAIRVVKDLVHASTREIASRMGVDSDGLSLMKRGMDLHVHVDNFAFGKINKTYQMAPLYMSMVSLVFGRRMKDDVMVFGDVGSSGSLSCIWKLEVNHIQLYRRHGYRQVIVGFGAKTKISEEAKATAGAIQSDGRPFVDIVIVGNIMDALPLCFGVLQS